MTIDELIQKKESETAEFKENFGTDTIETAVTWDNLINLWESVKTYVYKRQKIVLMSHISHVYENGANLYITFLSPMKQGDEINDYVELHKGLVDTIVENKGSISHHHGVGRVLSKWMKLWKLANLSIWVNQL